MEEMCILSVAIIHFHFRMKIMGLNDDAENILFFL